MKDIQTMQNNYAPANREVSVFTPVNYFKGFGTAFISSRLFTAKNRIAALQQEVAKNGHEIAGLKWQLVQKTQLVQNIAFHQSHMVRRPLANILGIIELLNNSKNDINNPGLLEMISLLKISADDLDKAIKHISAVSNL